MVRMPLVRLGSPQLAVLATSLLALLAAVWVLDAYSWQEFYVREFAVPRIQDRYGFRSGRISFRCYNSSFESWGITKVTPGGEFALMGVRPGDVPFQHHGNGFTAMYHSVVAAERGHFAAFNVANANACNAGIADKEEVRSIVVRPRAAQLAVTFYSFLGGELSSPDGKFVLVAVPPARAEEKTALWVRDVATGEAVSVYSYASRIDVVWATDASWIALSESDSTKCLLLNPKDGEPLDVSALRARTLPSGARIECEVFGWLRGNSLVALRTWTYDDGGRLQSHESVFFDASSRTFVRSSDVQR